MNIRPLAVGDLELLRQLSITTFSETFSKHNTPENLALYLSRAFDPETLLRQLENPASSFYFVLEGDKPFGYMKLNEASVQTEFQDADALELERIYVLNNGHGKGYAQALMQHAIEEAGRRNKRSLWLGVWQENHRAQAFYRKYGFEVTGTHEFVMGSSRQIDYIMRRNILV